MIGKRLIMLKKYLVHPLTRDLDIDDPHTTHLRRQIIHQKSFLRQIYQEWYKTIATTLPIDEKPVLELGSGAGFLNDFVPNLITSEIFYCSNINVALDGQKLPFANKALRGLVMTDVLHHLPQSQRFFSEAIRCVQPGGVISMIEPWVTPWSRLIYTKLHHEPFHTDVLEWKFPSCGPLSGANGALPWIIFERDRLQFEKEFSKLKIQLIKPIMPFRYLVSGGVSLRSLMPSWTFNLWRIIENALEPWMNNLAMFAHIVLRRIE
jgi:SAM-dependent methyltransferase